MKAYVVENEALSYNIEWLKKKAGAVPIWAVIKGNGYGIGALPLARHLAGHGIDHFCITEVREAELLRENGFDTAQILMLRSTGDPAELNRLLDLRVILTVGSWETAVAIDEAAGARSDMAEVHLKIDTGMGRYGFLPGELDRIKAVYDRKHLAVSGIYTHFNCAFNDKKLTKQEFSEFMQVVEQLRAAGYETGIVHCCNSSAFLRFPEMYCDGVRLGSALLGRVPFHSKLKPVGFVETQVEEVRVLPKGHTTGYGAVWKARENTRVAVIPVGWYNGFQVSCQTGMPRFRDCMRTVLSGLRGMIFRRRPLVEVNGHRCPVIGQVGMLHVVADVRGVECKPGDRAILQINPLHVKGMKIQYR